MWRRILIWLKDFHKTLSHVNFQQKFEMTHENAIKFIKKLEAKKILINKNKKE